MQRVSKRVTKILNSENLKKEKLFQYHPAVRVLLVVSIGGAVGLLSSIGLVSALIATAIALMGLLVSLWLGRNSHSFFLRCFMLICGYASCVGVGLIVAGRIAVYDAPRLSRQIDIPLVVRGAVVSALPTIENDTLTQRFIVRGEVSSYLRGVPTHEALVCVHVSRFSTDSMQSKPEQWDIGDSILVRGNGTLPADRPIVRRTAMTLLPNDIDARLYARGVGVQWIIRSYSSRCIRLARGEHYALRDWWDDGATIVLRLREQYIAYARAVFRSSYPALQSSVQVMIAMLTGYDRAIDPTLYQSFRIVGTIHILSIGGFHIALLIAALQFVLAQIRHRGWQTIVQIAMLLLYAILSGWSISEERACIMMILMLIVRLVDRTTSLLNIFATAILVMVCIHPASVLSMGFQLSVASVSMLILCMPFIQQYIGRYSSVMIRQGVGLILATWVGSAGAFMVLIAHGQPYSAWSIIANAIVVPLCAIAILWGACALILNAIALLVGFGYGIAVVTWLAHAGLCMLWCVEWFQQMIVAVDQATLWGNVAWIAWGIHVMLLLYILMSASHRQMLSRVVVSSVLLSAVLIMLRYSSPQQQTTTLLRETCSATLYKADTHGVAIISDHVIDSLRYARWGDTLHIASRYPRPKADVSLAKFLRGYPYKWVVFAQGESALRTALIMDSSSVKSVVVTYPAVKDFMFFALVEKLEKKNISILKQSDVVTAMRRYSTKGDAR